MPATVDLSTTALHTYMHTLGTNYNAIYTYVYIYTDTHTHTRIYIYIYATIHSNMCTPIHTHVYVYVRFLLLEPQSVVGHNRFAPEIGVP
jgi:hypothetical protein